GGRDDGATARGGTRPVCRKAGVPTSDGNSITGSGGAGGGGVGIAARVEPVDVALGPEQTGRGPTRSDRRRSDVARAVDRNAAPARPPGSDRGPAGCVGRFGPRRTDRPRRRRREW